MITDKYITSDTLAIILGRTASYILKQIKTLKVIMPESTFAECFELIKSPANKVHAVYDISLSGVHSLKYLLSAKDRKIIENHIKHHIKLSPANETEQKTKSVQTQKKSVKSNGAKKSTFLTPAERKEVKNKYIHDHISPDILANAYDISLATVYRIIHEDMGQTPVEHKSPVDHKAKNTLTAFYHTHKKELGASYRAFVKRLYTRLELVPEQDYRSILVSCQRNGVKRYQKFFTEAGMQKLLDNFELLTTKRVNSKKKISKETQPPVNKKDLKTEVKLNIAENPEQLIMQKQEATLSSTCISWSSEHIDVLKAINKNLEIIAKNIDKLCEISHECTNTSTSIAMQTDKAIKKEYKPHRPVAAWRSAANNKVRAIACAYASSQGASVDKIMKDVYNMIYNQLQQEAHINLDVEMQKLANERNEKVTRLDAIEASSDLTKQYLKIVDETYNNFFYDKNKMPTGILPPSGDKAA